MIFIKNGYSVWTHLVPFAIAAILLFILSIPQDNLFLRLVRALEQVNWIWVPACFLTIIIILVYIRMIETQIQRAYLWPDGDWRRTIGTSVVYIVLCTVIAYVVLRSVTPYQLTPGEIWACLLLALLSLTGVGLPRPDSWVEAMGIVSPDYTRGRLDAKRLVKILHSVRSKPRAEQRDVKDFLEAAKGLCSNIEKNRELEPNWAQDSLDEPGEALKTLTEQIEKLFPVDNISKLEGFATACKCQQEFHYKEFIKNVEILADYWSEWQCP